VDAVKVFQEFGPVWITVGILLTTLISILWFLLRTLKRIQENQMELIERLSKRTNDWGEVVYRVILNDSEQIHRMLTHGEKEK